MKRLVLAAAVSLCGCFDFDSAYSSYCARVSCDGGVLGAGGGVVIFGGGTATAGGTAGGSTAGGSAAGGSAGGSVAGGTAGGTAGGSSAGGTAGGDAGGSTAGGSTAGGSTAGGSAGGSTAGGSSAGGSAAGGSAGGSTAGGAAIVDAGVQCVGVPFCVHRHTARNDARSSAVTVGEGLDDAIAIFTKLTTPRASNWVTHGPDGQPSMGTSRVFTVGFNPPIDVGGNSGTPGDFIFISESDQVNASLRRVIDGGTPLSRYGGTCQGQSVLANTFARRGNRVIVGGYNDGLCEVDLATGGTTLLQAEGTFPTNIFVNGIAITADGGIYWSTSDGFIGQLGRGRITAEIDVDGMTGIDCIDNGPVWASSYSGTVVKSVDDGGFELVTNVAETTYGMTVTPDGVFIGAFGGIFHSTRFTDGGFDRFILPLPATQRIYSLTGASGALHVAGNHGNFSSPDEAFFLTLIPRTQ